MLNYKVRSKVWPMARGGKPPIGMGGQKILTEATTPTHPTYCPATTRSHWRELQLHFPIPVLGLGGGGVLVAGSVLENFENGLFDLPPLHIVWNLHIIRFDHVAWVFGMFCRCRCCGAVHQTLSHVSHSMKYPFTHVDSCYDKWSTRYAEIPVLSK